MPDLSSGFQGLSAFFASARVIYTIMTIAGVGVLTSAFRTAHDQVRKSAADEQKRLLKERSDLITEIDTLQRRRFDETITIMQSQVDRSTAKCDELKTQLDQVTRRVHNLEAENETLREAAVIRDKRIFQLETELTQRNIALPPPPVPGV